MVDPPAERNKRGQITAAVFLAILAVAIVTIIVVTRNDTMSIECLTLELLKIAETLPPPVGAFVVASILTVVHDNVVKHKQTMANAVREGRKALFRLQRQPLMDLDTAKTAYDNTKAGTWRPTPPSYNPPLLPTWGKTTPLFASDASHLQCPPFPVLSSSEDAKQLQQVLELGEKASTQRTEQQTRSALFWASRPPPVLWMHAVHNVAVDKLDDMSYLMVMYTLSRALSDAGVIAWKEKYRYDVWRPISAAPQNWEPLLTTPDFPTYVSGHSVFSGAAAAVLEKILPIKSLRFPVSDGNDLVFTSWTEAAEDAGMSRIWGGVHFMVDNTEGLRIGGNIGKFTLAGM